MPRTPTVEDKVYHDGHTLHISRIEPDKVVVTLDSNHRVEFPIPLTDFDPARWDETAARWSF
jgi:hypothetical protein